MRARWTVFRMSAERLAPAQRAAAAPPPGDHRRIRVLVLPRYGRLGASSRLRFLQYLPALESQGIDFTVSPLFDDAALDARYQRGSYRMSALLGCYLRRVRVLLRRHRYDLLWIEKEALPWWPWWIEHFLLGGVPYVLDFDDAIFHNYDLNSRAWVRRLFAARVDRLMARAGLVVAGNPYLARRAHAADAPRVEIVPTVIDLERYAAPPVQRPADGIPRVVWIGSPSTERYLWTLAGPLQKLARESRFVLRIIGGGALQLPGVEVEHVAWTESTEVESIAQCDIGIMPLVDSPWEQGKCGYKLIQYMACGLPVVASPVGANVDIVEDGGNGFFAVEPEVWVTQLARLLCDHGLRQRMGAAGRRRVEADFCLQVQYRRLAAALHEVAG